MAGTETTATDRAISERAITKTAMDEHASADVLGGEQPLEVPPELYINRELSWIEFNYRVLAQALNEHTPLLEQAKFSAIFSNNLDEFFMVRVASLKSQQEAGVATLSDDGRTALEQLEDIQAKLRPLLDLQQQHYRHSLKNQLAEHGVQLTDYASLNHQQRQWLDDYFRTAIFPVLTPLAVDPSHPFPFISNLSLNVAVLVRDPDTGQQQFARVKVPQKILPRFVEVPPQLSGREHRSVFTAVPLEQVVAFNLGLLFPGMVVEGHYFFRITRDADLELRDLEADDRWRRSRRACANGGAAARWCASKSPMRCPKQWCSC